jgi:hypothetical protein
MKIQKFNQFISESIDINNKIKEIILNGYEFDSFIEALELKYGQTIPLYHATTLENAEIIDKEGIRPVNGKNYKSFSSNPFVYFQIGKSDYIDDSRCVLYKWDAPIEAMNYADADMDGVNVSEDDLEKMGIDVDDIASDMRDIIRYFIWNDMKLDGMELIFTDLGGDFPEIKPIRVN